MGRTMSRRAVLAGSMLAPIASLVATESREQSGQSEASVPTFRGNLARTGAHPGPGPVGTPEARWQVRLGMGLSSSPSVVENTVYIGSVSPGTVEGGALHAVDARTGIEVWRRSTAPGDGILASPSVASGLVVVGTYDGVALAVDASTGEERWRFQAEAAFSNSPGLVDGIAYFADTGAHLYALAAESGEELWRVVSGDGVTRAFATPALDAGVVYCLDASRRQTDAAYLHAYDAVSGEEHWRFSPGAGTGLAGTPVVSDGMVYAGTRGAIVHVVDQSSGEGRGEYDFGTPLRTELAVVGGTVYAGTDDGDLRTLDAVTGEPLWRLGLNPDAPLVSPPTVAGGMIYVGDAAGVMHAADAVTGIERWKAAIGSLQSSPAIVGGMLLVGSNTGWLRAVGGKGGATATPSASAVE